MIRVIILGATLLALAACSTNHRLLAPDPEARHISPEKDHQVAKKGVDPVCGALMDNASTFWHSSYRGTIYYFDSAECKAHRQGSPYFPVAIVLACLMGGGASDPHRLNQTPRALHKRRSRHPKAPAFVDGSGDVRSGVWGWAGGTWPDWCSLSSGNAPAVPNGGARPRMGLSSAITRRPCRNPYRLPERPL